MTSQISMLIAKEHVADLRREAEKERIVALARNSGSRDETAVPALALRTAGHGERTTVRRLAQLDDAVPLEGDVLLALVDGEAVAALSLTDGRIVANPFVRTTQAVALLRLRADQLSVPERGHGLRARLRPLALKRAA